MRAIEQCRSCPESRIVRQSLARRSRKQSQRRMHSRCLRLHLRRHPSPRQTSRPIRRPDPAQNAAHQASGWPDLRSRHTASPAIRRPTDPPPLAARSFYSMTPRRPGSPGANSRPGANDSPSTWPHASPRARSSRHPPHPRNRPSRHNRYDRHHQNENRPGHFDDEHLDDFFDRLPTEGFRTVATI